MENLVNLNIYAFLMVFLRLGTALMIMPGFMSSYVNTQVRLSVAVALSIVLMPLIAPQLPPQPRETLLFLQYIFSEIVVGLFIGLVMQILFTALNLAGFTAGQAIGFGNAQIFDPATQNQSIVVETFLSIVALTVIFLTDIHHLMLSAVIDSYALLPVSAKLPLGDFADNLSRSFNQSFVIGFKIGSPFIAFTIIFYSGIGLVSRLMPQLNIFFLSLPLQIYLGLGLLFITAPVMIIWFTKYFEDGVQQFLR